MESTNNRILYTIFLSTTAVTIGALAFYMAESNVEGTKVTNLSDAFWWAIVTVNMNEFLPEFTDDAFLGS